MRTAAVLKSTKSGNPTKNFAGAGFCHMCQKWMNAPLARAVGQYLIDSSHIYISCKKWKIKNTGLGSSNLYISKRNEVEL